MPNPKKVYPVCLEVMYERYERYTDGGIARGRISANTLKEAILKMLDRIRMYKDREIIKEIEEEEDRILTAEEIIKMIEEENGDGCDYIFSLKDLVSGIVYIENGNGDKDNDWEE